MKHTVKLLHLVLVCLQYTSVGQEMTVFLLEWEVRDSWHSFPIMEPPKHVSRAKTPEVLLFMSNAPGCAAQVGKVWHLAHVAGTFLVMLKDVCIKGSPQKHLHQNSERFQVGTAASTKHHSCWEQLETSMTPSHLLEGAGAVGSSKRTLERAGPGRWGSCNSSFFSGDLLILELLWWLGW